MHISGLPSVPDFLRSLQEMPHRTTVPPTTSCLACIGPQHGGWAGGGVGLGSFFFRGAGEMALGCVWCCVSRELGRACQRVGNTGSSTDDPEKLFVKYAEFASLSMHICAREWVFPFPQLMPLA